MRIVRLREARFGNEEIARVVSGYALYEEGKGYYAYSHDCDEYGIVIPYMPCGGRKALQSIINGGGFVSMDGMEFVEPINSIGAVDYHSVS